MRFSGKLALGFVAVALSVTVSACGGDATATGSSSDSGSSSASGVDKAAFIEKFKEDPEMKELLKDIPEDVATCMLDLGWESAQKYDPAKLKSFVEGKITMDELGKEDKSTADENIAKAEKCVKKP
ncbi:hypothetical protein GCM10009560_46520 [Nonomuraea longicatena]|uniref:Lipoprotein n=2 Tax=Nonomuraea longicatena TaxID=83682 RepID=A0ABN1Q448_9ACTN